MDIFTEVRIHGHDKPQLSFIFWVSETWKGEQRSDAIRNFEMFQTATHQYEATHSKFYSLADELKRKDHHQHHHAYWCWWLPNAQRWINIENKNLPSINMKLQWVLKHGICIN